MAGIFSSITDAATGLFQSKDDTPLDANSKERKTLESAYIPTFVIDIYQAARKSVKIPAQTGWSIWGVVAGIVVLTYILAVILALLVKKLLKSPIFRALLIFAVLALISYVLYYFYGKPDSRGSIIDEAKHDITSLFGKDGFQVKPEVPDGDQSLMNLQPFAVRQTGYIGPKERGGNFDLETGLHIPLKAGVRFFTLQIDFLDVQKDANKFAAPNEPTLLYRDDAGKLVSSNGASLREAVDGLAKFAFSEQVVNNTLPLVVYLHFAQTPNAVRSPQKYVEFLTKTAAALEPLLQYHLGITGDGSFVRQQAEATLFTTPIKALEKKVIFLSNIDTSMLRQPQAIGLAALEPKRDLDYLVHARVYAETAADATGATMTAEASRNLPVAVLVSLPRVLAMNQKDQEAFGQKGKGRFVIAMGKQIDGNPTARQLVTALDTLGVNAVPMNMFESNKEDLKRKLGLWKTNKFYRAKPLALQTIRQMPVGTGA